MKDFEIVFSSERGFEKVDLGSPISPAPKEARIRPLHVGICGTDTHAISLYQGESLRPGHEWVGVVEEVGTDVQKVKNGDIITTSSTLGCGECQFCLSGEVNFCRNPRVLTSEQCGALRTWINISEMNLILLGRDISPLSATLLEILAVGEQAAQLIIENGKNNGDALILGAGPIGLSIALVLRDKGFSVQVADLLPDRLERAEKLGLTTRHTMELATDNQFHHQFPLIVDAAGDGGCKERGGWPFLHILGAPKFHCLVVGKYDDNINISAGRLGRLGAKLYWMRGIDLNCMGRAVERWSREVEGLQEVMISHVFSPDNIDEAFEVARLRKNSMKVVVSLSK